MKIRFNTIIFDAETILKNALYIDGKSKGSLSNKQIELFRKLLENRMHELRDKSLINKIKYKNIITIPDPDDIKALFSDNCGLFFEYKDCIYITKPITDIQLVKVNNRYNREINLVLGDVRTIFLNYIKEIKEENEYTKVMQKTM